jgi:hypothetical protein
MKAPQRGLVVLGVLVTLLAVWAWSGEAKRPRAKRLRAEIAELRATLARLQSQVEFQARQVATRPVGVGGLCADPCASDSDGDGVGDCTDPCPCDASNADGDGDGAADCVDPCPSDPTDACADPCRHDSDGDGKSDCEDPCPYDPNGASDDDQDGVPDCQDPCPNDPSNDCIGPCPLLDQDGDGLRDCSDPCPWGEATGMPCTVPPTKPSPGDCQRSGCSGQVCAAEPVGTTCEWRAEYACYADARCERQPDGACGWTPTPTLEACLAAH